MCKKTFRLKITAVLGSVFLAVLRTAVLGMAVLRRIFRAVLGAVLRVILLGISLAVLGSSVLRVVLGAILRIVFLCVGIISGIRHV